MHKDEFISLHAEKNFRSMLREEENIIIFVKFLIVVHLSDTHGIELENILWNYSHRGCNV